MNGGSLVWARLEGPLQGGFFTHILAPGDLPGPSMWPDQSWGSCILPFVMVSKRQEEEAATQEGAGTTHFCHILSAKAVSKPAEIQRGWETAFPDRGRAMWPCRSMQRMLLRSYLEMQSAQLSHHQNSVFTITCQVLHSLTPATPLTSGLLFPN